MTDKIPVSLQAGDRARLRTEAFISSIVVINDSQLRLLINVLAVGCAIEYFSSSTVQDFLQAPLTLLRDESDSESITWFGGSSEPVYVSKETAAEIWPSVRSLVATETERLNKYERWRRFTRFDFEIMDHIVDFIGRMSSRRMLSYEAHLRANDWLLDDAWVTELILPLLLRPQEYPEPWTQLIQALDGWPGLELLDDGVKFESILQVLRRPPRDILLNLKMRARLEEQLAQEAREVYEQFGDTYPFLGSTVVQLFFHLDAHYTNGGSGDSSRHVSVLQLSELLRRRLAIYASELLPSYRNVAEQFGVPSFDIDHYRGL